MLIVLGSASGAPGVTTTAVALALLWPRPVVLVDADPVGGSAILAGYFRGEQPNKDPLVRLWTAQRHGRLAEQLPQELMRVADTQVDLILGPAGPAQARGVHGLWDGLAPHLRAADNRDQDVLVDVGRFGAAASPDAVVDAADLVVVVTRSDLVSVSATQARLTDFSSDLPVGVCVVGPGRPYSERTIESVIGHSIIGSIPFQPEAAQAYSHGSTVSLRRRAGFDRAIVALGEGLRARISAERARLEVKA